MPRSWSLPPLWLAAGVVAMVLIRPALADDAGTKNFPAIKLRGYGTLTGNYTADGAGGSVLRIDCEDAEHARLVQAKYLSDLEELPPGTEPGQIDVAGKKISIRMAEDVGALAVLRNGTTVIIATAKTAAALSRSIPNAVTGEITQWTSEAEGKVPMFLDRFDKYGFRFYYQPQSNPIGPDGKEVTDYDPTECFDFALASNHAGLVVWNESQQSETGEGMNQDPSWEWIVKKAQRMGLPFGVNLSNSSWANTWLFNRHPETVFQYAPTYGGGVYGNMNYNEGPGVAWSSEKGQDAMLADLQVSVRHLNGYDNITSWLEPHGELSNGVANIMIDTGPGADANYQKYLADKYKTIEALSQRWYGNITSLVSWQDVKVPEPAYFLGWSPEAISLNGKWRVNYDQPDNPAALATDFDDSTWGEQMNQSPKRALVRRHVKIDAGWLTKHPKPWLYVMDFNDTRNGASNPSENIVVSVNGKTLREDPPVYQEGHWTVLNVADILHAGDNTVAIRLPRGRFNYRVYFSGDEPKSYPNLGPERNAQWVDFINWCSATRAHAVRRGMQMIRQIDPDRGIVLMSPYGFENDMLQPAIEYGGDFHDTGSMGGWWNDRSPALTRGAGLPNSVEPGSGPAKPSDMLISFGNWITEGANAIDHFQSIGEVLWHPEIKKCFEDHQAMYTSIGRYHPRTAQIAALTSTWVPTLFDFPWSFRPATENGQPVFRGSGYISPFNCRSLFSLMEHVPVGPAYDSDAVNENMLERDQAGKYRVIIDTDTAVMTEATIDGIERYVRGGGIFVTYGETGRHSPEKPDTWPIDRLTGFHATDAQPWQGTIALAETQSVFPKDWSLSGNIQGHHFKPIAPDVQTLMTWNGGSTAVGLRPLGKGFVVTVGPWFDRSKGNAFFSRLFQWLKIDPIPARMETSGPEIFWRHFVSNNGLYDVWVAVNSNGKNQTVTGNLALTNGVAPAWYLDLKTGQRSTVTDAHLPVNLPPHEMAMYITPRAAIAESSADWFNLQRGWWQGTADPGPPLAPLEMKLIVDLTDDWAFQPVDAQHADVKALVAPAVDDKSWPRMRLGIFTLPDHPDVKHAVLRKHFRIPDGWNHGRILFRLPPSHGQAYLDGQALTTSVQLAAGSEHVVALDIAGKAARVGTDGCAWLTYHPEPVSRQDLSGPWEGWADKTKDWMPLTLPGKYDTGINAIRKVVVIDAHAAEGKTVILHLMQAPGQNESGGNVSINGHGMGPWRLRESNEINQNITPWVKPGQENEIKIPTVYGRVNVTEVSLEFHDKGTYP